MPTDVGMMDQPCPNQLEIERLKKIALDLHTRIEKYSTLMKEIASQTDDYLVKHQINSILSGEI